MLKNGDVVIMRDGNKIYEGVVTDDSAVSRGYVYVDWGFGLPRKDPLSWVTLKISR